MAPDDRVESSGDRITVNGKRYPDPDKREVRLGDRERTIIEAQLDDMDRTEPVWDVRTERYIPWMAEWSAARRAWIAYGDKAHLEEMRRFVTGDCPPLASRTPPKAARQPRKVEAGVVFAVIVAVIVAVFVTLGALGTLH